MLLVDGHLHCGPTINNATARGPYGHASPYLCNYHLQGKARCGVRSRVKEEEISHCGSGPFQKPFPLPPPPRCFPKSTWWKAAPFPGRVLALRQLNEKAESARKCDDQPAASDLGRQVLSLRSPQLTSPQRGTEGPGGRRGVLVTLNATRLQREGVPRSCWNREAVDPTSPAATPPVSAAGPLRARDRAERSGRRGRGDLGASDLWMSAFRQPHGRDDVTKFKVFQ